MDTEYMNELIGLSTTYGTPLYIYDFDIVYKQYLLLKDTMPECMQVFYSMKSNPSIGLLSLMKNFVTGVEVSSEGELYSALYSGFSPEHIVFVGPGKSKEELEYAISSNILAIVVESKDEILKINEISRRLGRKTAIAIRINPQGEVSGARIKMGGMSKQFGIDEEALICSLVNIKEFQNIKLLGIHVYMGTQNLQEDVIVGNFEKIFSIAKDIQQNLGVKLSLIDFGGGYGVPYFLGENYLDLKRINSQLNEIFKKYSNFFDFSNMTLITESGRFLVSESGYFLTKVLFKKYSRGKAFIITDGGSNHHSAAAGLGRFIRQNFPITVLKQTELLNTETVDIVGPLCTPTDVLAQNVELPKLEEGDILAILKSGAYAFTASPLGMLSHPSPAEVLLYKNKHYLIREKGKKEDFLRGQFKVEI